MNGAGFDSDAWLSMTEQLTLAALESTRAADIRSETQLLAATAALARSSPVRILDFGGGMGIGYLMLRSALHASIEIEYEVVEGPRVSSEGKRILADHRSVRFSTAMPDPGARFDIVFACSSLQYIPDHLGLLAAFASYGPAHILLADVPAGDIPTFWTAQLTVPGSRIAYKFMNLDEISRAMTAHGYRLLVRGVVERGLDVGSLPASHRVERTCNLLFGR